MNLDAAGSAQLRIRSSDGRSCEIQRSGNLGDWMPIDTLTISPGATDFADPAAGAMPPPGVYYRAVEVAPPGG